jgi:hypothetical protein
VVVDKVAHATHVTATNDSGRVSLEGYQSAHNSLGIFMDYRPQYCSLLPFQETTASLVNCNMAKHVHVIFIGDSVMRMQYELFRSSVPNIKTTFVRTNGGIVQTMRNVTSRLVQLKQFSNERRFILFNTGLHDISRLCSRKWRQEREAHRGPDSNFSCTAQYRHSLGELVDFLRAYPAERKVFQSTTAGARLSRIVKLKRLRLLPKLTANILFHCFSFSGWPRFGNFGVEWPVNEPQSLSLSSNMVAHFNEIAYDVLSRVDGIHVLDVYWLTLARPDNRQVGLGNNVLGEHMVHPGQEVLHAMARVWMQVLLLSMLCACSAEGDAKGLQTYCGETR